MNGGLISLIWLGSLLSLPINELRELVSQRDRSSSIAHSPRRKPEPQHAEVTERLTASNYSVIRQESRDQPANRKQNLKSIVQRASVPKVNPIN